MHQYQELPETTRVWIYHSNRPFKQEDLPEIEGYMEQFVQQWVSHNRALRAYGKILYDRLVVLMVDESQAGASGCSIDKSVNFLKALQQKYQVDLFDRMIFSYKTGDQIQSVDRETFSQLYANGQIDDATLVVDTLVNNKGDFERNLLKPLGQSWHKRMV